MITNTRSSVEPFLTYSTTGATCARRSGARSYNRGDNGDAHDNNAIITEILKLRAERAKLLGYPTHAHWRLDDTMAKTPERGDGADGAGVEAGRRARARGGRRHAGDRRQGEARSIKIEPWDYRYYAEKVRKAKYDLDQNEVKPYLQLEKLREGMFWVAGELYGFEFTPVTDVPVYHPDVRVWEVTTRHGKHVGLWYFDPYARAGKRSGAWMNAYRNQETLRAARSPPSSPTTPTS